jgi:hypothetical protein
MGWIADLQPLVPPVIRVCFSETDQNRGCDVRSHVVSEYVEEVG